MPKKNVFISKDAYIGENVKIGNNVIIYEGAIIEDNVTIGDNVIIGHPTKKDLQGIDFSSSSEKTRSFIIKKRITKIGEGSIIRAGTIIYSHVILGKNIATGHNALIREHTQVDDNSIIGTNAVLDGYIRVLENTFIQTNVYIAQSVRIGKGVFIAPNVIFLDNKKIIMGEGLNGAVVGNFVRIGGGAIILPLVKIGDYSLIGAGSVVTKDVPEKALVFGIPAKIIRYLSNEEIEKYIKSIIGWR